MKEHTIVITGAGSGIGKAFAEGFLKEGATVVAADINPQGLNSLNKLGAHTQITDVSSEKEVRAMIARAVQETGRVDVLFNNAGIGSRKRIEDLEDGEFERMVQIHLFGTIYGMKAAIPLMRKQEFGRIINTISRGAEAHFPGGSAYGAAKAGIYVATRIAAAELADSDILVNALIPGPTNTAIWGKDMPTLQTPDVVYPTARLLATLPRGGPSGEVFWDEKEYTMFDPNNEIAKIQKPKLK